MGRSAVSVKEAVVLCLLLTALDRLQLSSAEGESQSRSRTILPRTSRILCSNLLEAVKSECSAVHAFVCLYVYV